MRERVLQVMADAFELEPSQIPDDASPDTVEEWDSLGHMNLMLALEAEFSVEIPTETMLELLSLDDIVDFLQTREGLGSD